MAKLSSMIPQRSFEPRVWDDSKPNYNRVTLKGPGPRAGHIHSISKPFYERNVGTKDLPSWQSVPPQRDEEGALKPGIIPRIRIYVTFDRIKNTNPTPEQLKLGLKVTLSDSPKATLTEIMSAFLAIPKEKVGDHDTDELVGKPCAITTRNTKSDVTIVKSIAPPIIDEPETATAASRASNGVIEAAVPAPAPYVIEEDGAQDSEHDLDDLPF
jgi:hypothetical protein